MEEKKLPFTGREKIRFNVPPFTGREYEYVRQAVENQKICGNGEFTKKASVSRDCMTCRCYPHTA